MSQFRSHSVQLTGLLEAAGALGCLATIIGWLGSLHWTLALFSHFRVQYALGLGILALLLTLMGARRSAALTAVFCLVNIVVIAPGYFSNSASTITTRGPELRVLTQNVNINQGDPADVAAFLRTEDAGLVALQETDERWQEMLEALTDVYPHRLIVNRADNFGIALLSKWPFESIESFYPASVELPSIRALVNVHGVRLRVVATHPPPPVGPVFAQHHRAIMAALVQEFSEQDASIFLGDLNTTRWGHSFRELLDRSGLKDSSAGFGVQPTWPMQFWPLLIPIDHVLCSPQLKVLDRRTGPRVGSDHLAVIVDIQLPGADQVTGRAAY